MSDGERAEINRDGPFLQVRVKNRCTMVHLKLYTKLNEDDEV